MRNKPDAYEMNEDSSLNKVVKCPICSFHAVKAQFMDCGNKCPVCGEPMKVKRYKEE
jgi:hypothetical protein